MGNEYLFLNIINAKNNVSLSSNGGIFSNTIFPIINILGSNINLTSPIAIGTNPIEEKATSIVNVSAPVKHVHQN